MRMIKVGDKYLGLVDRQGDAIKFDYERPEALQLLDAVNAGMTGPFAARIVKVTTLADRTADSMRGLAQDVEGYSEPDPEREGQDRYLADLDKAGDK